MVVKTITVTEYAYETLKGLKHSNESFSEVIVRVGSRHATAKDLFGILRSTPEQVTEHRKRFKRIRQKLSQEVEDRIKSVSNRHISTN